MCSSRSVKKILSVLLFFAVLATLCLSPSFAPQSHAVITEIRGNGGDYTDNATVARRLDVVFSEFPVGSFFSYTGQACTCHDKCSYYGGCDCISIYSDPEKNGEKVRLYSCQCMGFAHYMFYKLFGFVDRPMEYPENNDKYYSLGSLRPAEMTVANVKKLFSGVKTGANVRAKGTHSFIVLSTNENGLYVYHANTGVACRVDGWFWTWEELTEKYKKCGFEYIHLPTEYPESTGDYVPPAEAPLPVVPEYQQGQVRVNTGASSTLRLRSLAGTNGSILASIPHTTLLTITEIVNGWGKTTYDGKVGWVSLAYTMPVLRVSVPMDCFYTYDGTPRDMTGLSVMRLREDMQYETLPETAYTLTYSTPEGGQYSAVITVDGQTVSFDILRLSYGDMDADLAVTAADVTILARALSDPNRPLTQRQTEGADVDRNGTVDRNDVVAIIDYLTGKRLLLPEEGEE